MKLPPCACCGAERVRKVSFQPFLILTFCALCVGEKRAGAFMARWDAAQYVLRACRYEGDLRIADVPNEATRLDAVRALRAMYACGLRYDL